MSERDFVKEMEAALKPGGTLPVVRLQFDGAGAYFKEDFIAGCFKTLKARMYRYNIQRMMGEPAQPLNDLERLAVYLLADSAGVKFPGDDIGRTQENG